MFLSFLLLIPLLAIVLIICKAPPKATALTAATANLLLSLLFAVEYQPGPGFQFVELARWMSVPGLPTIAWHLGIDGINLPLVLLATVVTFAAIAISPRHILRAREFYCYLLFISLGVLGAFLSLDLFFLYIFHEFALIPTFILLGVWGTQNRQFASVQITLYLTLGSLLLLAGLIALVSTLPASNRSFDLPVVIDGLRIAALDGAAQKPIFALLLVGFGILVSLFPFHTWAPPGYASAPPAAAMLHAGVLKKFGLYGLLRVAMPLLPGGAEALQPLLLALLLGNVLYVGFVTLAQRDLTMMLGYSSVMHMGYLFLGLVSLNEIGWSGMIVLMVAHGLSTALLFAVAGEVQARTGEVRFAELGGLAQKMPFLAVMFMIGAMASLGMPGLGNFSGEILIFFGAWRGHPIVTGLALWGVVISAVYLLRAARNVFFGDLPAALAHVADLPSGWKRTPYLLLAVSLLAIGFAPGLLLRWITPSVQQLLASINS